MNINDLDDVQSSFPDNAVRAGESGGRACMHATAENFCGSHNETLPTRLPSPAALHVTFFLLCLQYFMVISW